MNRELHLASNNSGELYTISYPKSILGFCQYDFSDFSRRCAEICQLSLVTGEFYEEEALNIRNSLIPCHKYYEKNIRTVFDKIVVDCWIDFLCKESKITSDELWERCLPCKTAFERVIFTRICEFKHNQAINRWTTLVQLQQYALRKIDFIFGEELTDASEAKARENSFDLIFNVAANELGYHLDEFGGNMVFSSGSVPNSPFIHSTESKEIMRKFLANVPYRENTNSVNIYAKDLSDKTVMDAFKSVMQYIPVQAAEATGVIKSLTLAEHEVYLPTGFKSVLDLEISALIGDSAYLQRCKLCGAYYVRDASYNYDYCDTLNEDGTSCLATMAKESPEKLKTSDKPDLNECCDNLYREMSARINTDMTQRDFTDWYRFLLTIKENILNGKATMEDFEHFTEYSRTISFNVRKSSLTEETAPSESEAVRDTREVKNFVFQRINRSDIEPPKKEEPKPQVQEVTAVPVKIPAIIPTPPPTRIIRGGYIKSFPYMSMPITPDENKGVYIPINSGFTNTQHTEEKAPAIDDLVESAAVDEDIKIYDVPEYEDKIVKVYEPKIKHEVEKDLQVGIADSEPENTDKDAPVFEEDEDFTQAIPDRITLRQPPANVRTAKAVSAYKTVLPAQRTPRVPENEGAFATLLGSIDRSDGFSEDGDALDANGVPISHKTKHVMDAIFKTSTNTSPSLRLNDNNKI